MAVKAKGTLLQFNEGALSASTGWETLATVETIKPPKLTSKDIETTHLTSEAMERLPGLPDGSGAEATIQYDAEQAGTLDEMFGEVLSYRVLYPDGTGRRWTGWISESGEEETKQDDIIKTTIKLSVTGKVEKFTGGS
jgi:hypothetical protein